MKKTLNIFIGILLLSLCGCMSWFRGGSDDMQPSLASCIETSVFGSLDVDVQSSDAELHIKPANRRQICFEQAQSSDFDIQTVQDTDGICRLKIRDSLARQFLNLSNRRGVIRVIAPPDGIKKIKIQSDKIRIQSSDLGPTQCRLDAQKIEIECQKTHFSRLSIGDIAMDHLRAHSISLEIDHRHHAWMRGSFSIDRLIGMGRFSCSIEGLKARHLDVSALHASTFHLSGTARSVKFNTKQSSRLDARNLKTCFCQVQTSDQSSAYVYATDTLRIKALDQSTVYYYKRPYIISRYANRLGSIIFVDPSSLRFHERQS